MKLSQNAKKVVIIGNKVDACFTINEFAETFGDILGVKAGQIILDLFQGKTIETFWFKRTKKHLKQDLSRPVLISLE